MKVIETSIEGVLIVEPELKSDRRGYFMETYQEEKFRNLGLPTNFVQDNHSQSKFGVLRGLHYQLRPKAQAKLIRCTQGEIFDVLVDLRKDSDTYGEWSSIILNEQNKLQFWIPEGFAHGFISLKDFSEVQYKTNEYWDKDYERSLSWKDQDLKIKWPLSSSDKKTSLQAE